MSFFSFAPPAPEMGFLLAGSGFFCSRKKKGNEIKKMKWTCYWQGAGILRTRKKNEK
jgi:hypothetical protein